MTAVHLDDWSIQIIEVSIIMGCSDFISVECHNHYSAHDSLFLWLQFSAAVVDNDQCTTSQCMLDKFSAQSSGTVRPTTPVCCTKKHGVHIQEVFVLPVIAALL